MELSYRLPANLLPTLEKAALLHNLGMTVDDARHHLAGRDLLQHVILSGLSRTQQRAITCMVRFHRKAVHPEEDPLFTGLSPAWQQRTLQLAALLRVADGLDYSQSQTTRIVNFVASPKALQVQLTGPHAGTDGSRAKRKSDLWESVFHIPFEPEKISPPPDLEHLQNQSIAMDSTLATIIQRMLAKQLLRWQLHESTLLAGESAGIKAVRASVRRIRKTLEIGSTYSSKKTWKKTLRSIRELETLLGAVRDLDILLLDAKNYLASRPTPVAANPESEFPVVSIWEEEQRKAQGALVEWFGKKKGSLLQSEVLSLLSSPPMRQNSLLSDVAPVFFRTALGEIKKRQGNLAKEKLKTYHRMRLALRQFRYSLELCGDALGPGADELAADVAKVQKRLGMISDAWLIQQRTTKLLDTWGKRQAKQNAPQLYGAQPILEYAQERRNQLPKLTKGIVKDWEPVRHAELARRIQSILDSTSVEKAVAQPSQK